MIETYAFLAMFTVQILALSVLFPARLIRYVRVKDAEFPDAVYEKLYPGIDRQLASNRFWNRFRAAHTVIAVLGLVLLGWMLGNMQLLGSAKAIMFPVFYFLLQLVPLLFLAFIGIRNASLLRPSMQERKRTAVLQRRGLFDFVSPPRVVVEVVIYLLFAAFMVYLMYFASNPIPKVIGYQMLGAVTLGFMLQAGWLYWRMYGRKVPMESDADRMRSTGVDARNSIYGTAFTVVLISLVITLPRLGMQGWLPFTLSAFFVIVAIHMSSRLSAAMHQPRADRVAFNGN
jgi:hypothetical protein